MRGERQRFPAARRSGAFCRGFRSLLTRCEEGLRPVLCTPPLVGALRPSTPGDFPVAGKVTKGAPRAAPFGIPQCVAAALFALAALRSVSRRATFCLQPRPICHFGLVGKWVFASPQAIPGSHPQLSIRGAAVRLCSLRAARSGTPFWGERQRRWGDDNAPQGGSGGLPPDTPLPTFIVK